MDSMHDKQGRANARAVHAVMGRVVPITLLDKIGADLDAISAVLKHIKTRINVNHQGAKALIAHAVAQEAEQSAGDSDMAGGFSFGDFLHKAEKVLGTATKYGRLAAAVPAAALAATSRLRGAGFSFGDFLRGAKRAVGDVADIGLSAARTAQQYAPAAARAASGLGFDRIAGLADRAGQIASYAPMGGMSLGGMSLGGYIVPAESQYRLRGGLALGGARKKSARAMY
jgi:hypothetical protein